MSLEPGGLYVFLTMRSDPGDCHWGLYLHYNTQTISIPNASDSSAPPKQRIVHKGKKYHVRNLGEGYMADHQVVGDMISTLFLVGLLRVGVMQRDAFDDVDGVITGLDARVPELSRGNSIYCRTWVTGILRTLVEKEHLTTGVLDADIWADIELFGEQEWAGAEKAIQPRPIAVSAVFL